MGGKHKQAQRTKNNARPSSSGRSAELLGSTIPQFTGFSTIKETPYVFPSYGSGMEDINVNIDSTFQLVLKKMSKKDSTTKLKALQEFTELVTSSEQEAVKAVLVFWTRIYCVLATDTEHKVREATQIAHYQVVLKVKRNLAPHLKQLIGPWFTSQYDTYAPAASAAIKSIEDAFPKNKTQEAIVFCQEEILTYVYENLMVHTSRSLNVTNVLKEDADAKYERVVISSLMGYTLYLDKLDKEQMEKAKEKNLMIITNQKFWKFCKNEVVPIRNAWYNVLKSLCQKVPEFIINNSKEVVNSVIQNLDESEPTVLFAVWEATLLVITTVENWWTYVSIEKLFLPKLYKLLREAGRGNATMIFPNLLPLLSNLPPTIDRETFYFKYFDNLQTGLKLKTTISIRSESTAICTTYIECLQYLIMTNQSNMYLCEKLIKTELLPMIEWGLMENQSVYKSLFNQISNLVQYWHRNRNEPDFSNYGKYLDYFWSNVQSLFEGLLMNEESREKNALSELALKQIEFLMSLKHISKPKKQMKVQFTENLINTEQNTIKPKEKCDETYLEALNTLVFKLCELYVKVINERLSKELVEHLYSIITEFENKNFFFKLNEVINKDGELVDLYGDLLSKWLNSGYICTESVVGLVFILLKYCDNKDKLKILESFESLPMDRFGWCLQSALSHPYNQDDVIHQWLSNPKVDEYLVKLAEDIVNSKSENDASNLLKMAFTEGEQGELFVSNTTVKKIIETLTKCLKNPLDHMHSLDNTGSFAAYLCSILYTEHNKLKYGTDLLKEIFKLLCNAKYEKDTITKDTLWELQTSVYDSIEILCGVVPIDEIKEVILDFSKIIETKLFSSNKLDIESVYNLIMGLIKSVKTTDEQIYTAELLFDKEFINDWRKRIVEMATLGEYINGKLSSPNEKINVSSDQINLENLLMFSEYLVLKLKVYSTCLAQFNLIFEPDDVTKEIISNELDKENETKEDDDVDPTLVIEQTTDDFDILSHLLYDFTLITTILDNYKCTDIYDQLEDVSINCFVYHESIIQKLDDINEYLLMKVEQCWLWEKTIYDYNILFKNQSKSGFYKWYNDRSKLYNVSWKYIIGDVPSNNRLKTKVPLIEEIVAFRNLSKGENMEKVDELFLKIEEYKNSVGEEFYGLNFAIWSDTEKSTEILRFCTEILDNFNINKLNEKHWDFMIISLTSWALKISDIKVVYKNIQIQSFIASVFNLFARIERYLKQLDPNLKRVKEFQDVFAEDVHNSFMEIWLYLTEQVLKEVKVKTTLLPFLQHIGNVIKYVNHEYIFKKDDNYWTKLTKQCCALLVNQSSILQMWGYEMLKVLKAGFIEMDSQTLNSNTPNEKGLILEKFKNVLHKTQEIVHILLSAMKLGEDSCRVQPHTDSYTYTFAYTLLWDFLHLLNEAASADLRFEYAEWLKNNNYLDKLLVHLFKLMPGEVLFYVPSESKIKPFSEYFKSKFELSMFEQTSSSTLERIVCWVFFMTMSQLPASVRQWWTDLESRSSQIVERVTSAYVSPQLCNEELEDVAQHETKFKNMVIKIHPNVREVVAIYTVDDIQMDLMITLPVNYPLVGPDVQCNKQIAGSSHKNWLMQLKKCLRYQNGRIWDGLSLWNTSLNKKFDGVEECYICFAVLHQGTYQLPKLSCQTCRKKFHSACLYKWFSTSNKSTCPICRNLF